MKKILASFVIITFLFLGLQVITVHAQFLFGQGKLDSMIRDMQNIFEEREAVITDISWDQQEDRRLTIQDYLTELFKKSSVATSSNLKQYKELYLVEMQELQEKISLHKPFEDFSRDKRNELKSEIETDIVDYLRELLGDDEESNNFNIYE